ncbi:unnamed protein product [Larinioides sclopetarius]|uniref:HSF-type DNA-binding domain-containing protein n=1 Tax=Larinioides sclopetarius TaxID=280406 RepID=A0AAV2BBF9_9ARAC
MSASENKAVSLFNMKFPEKLWLIVNDCDTGAIGWGPSGETITLDYEKFQEEFLDSVVGVFKTNNIASFIRQLNLYGFRKCNRYNDDKHEFKHPLFVKGRKDLMQFVKRKPGSSISLNSLIRTPRRSKVKTNTEFSQWQKENIMHEKLTKSESSIARKEVPKATLMRTPLSSIQNPSMMNPMRNLWWNNIPPPPYPTNFYCDRSIVEQGWFPVNSSFCNSQTFIKREPEEPQDDESSILKDAMASESQLAPKNNGNMYYLVVPGYPTTQGHNMYANPGYYGGMFPPLGMSVGFNPNCSRNPNPYLGDIPVKFETGN